MLTREWRDRFLKDWKDKKIAKLICGTDWENDKMKTISLPPYKINNNFFLQLNISPNSLSHWCLHFICSFHSTFNTFLHCIIPVVSHPY
jgi:hypothetical protein